MHFSDARRQWVQSLASLLLTSAGLPPLRAQTRGSMDRVTIAAEGHGMLSLLPLLLAEQLGYFQNEGLAVTIRDHASTAQAVHAVQQSAADLFAGSYEQLLLQNAREGAALRAFALLTRAPQVGLGVPAKGAHRYRSLKDLRGRKIGIPALESPAHTVAIALLAREGVMPDEVGFVPVGHASSAVQSLRAGRIHALAHTDPVVAVLEQRGELKLLQELRSLKGAQDVFGGMLPSACLYAHQAYLQRNPDRIKALTNGVVRALKWLQTAAPADLVKWIPEDYLLGHRGAYLAAFGKVRDTYSPFGVMPDDGPATGWRFVQAAYPALGASKLDLSKTFSNEWVLKARQKYTL